MGVDRYRVCELYAAGPDGDGSGSGYRLGDRLVLTARHVIAPALAGAGSRLLIRPVGVPGWLPARVEWEDADADATLIVVEDEHWRASAGESVLRWGELTGSDPVPCAAVGFPWASARPDRMRDTAHLYGHLAPLGQLKEGMRRHPRGPAGHRRVAARQAHHRPRPQQAACRRERPAPPPARPRTRRPAVGTGPDQVTIHRGETAGIGPRASRRRHCPRRDAAGHGPG